jgi:large subunit ribosomal protein L9
MSTEVILMAAVAGLGGEGEVVRVADGYARNYLLPKKLAAPVTAATRRSLEKRRKERDTELVAQRAGAQEMAQRLEQTSCTIAVKAGAEGKMFGSVTAADIIDSLKLQGIALDKQQLDLAEPLRELGVFNLPVKLHPDVQATLKVWVVEE